MYEEHGCKPHQPSNIPHQTLLVPVYLRSVANLSNQLLRAGTSISANNAEATSAISKADFVCYGKIIVELKAVSALEDAHRSQVYNYLHATGYKLGLLYNFGCSDELEKERIAV